MTIKPVASTPQNKFQTTSKMLRYAVIPLGIIAAAAGSVWWLEAQSQSAASVARSVGLPREIYAAGRVEGRRPQAGLRPWEHGRVTHVLVEEGEVVQAGQVLLKLDDDLHRHQHAMAAAELQQAQAELERLKNGARREEREEAAAQYQARLAQLEQARLTWNRTQSLHADGVVSHQQADDDRTRLVRLEAEVAAAKARMELIDAPARDDETRAAEARVAVARAKLDLARVQYERRQLRAPFAGRVLQIDVEPGEMAGPQSAEPALVMADTSQPRVRAFVEELEAPLVQIGMPAQVVTDGLPGVVFHGTVTQISPRMDSKKLFTHAPSERYDTKTREVWIDLQSGDGLVVGLRVDVFMKRIVKDGSVPLHMNIGREK